MTALRETKDAPVLPGRLPLLGHMTRVRSNALEFMRAAQARLGPVFWLDMGFDHWLFMVVDEPGFSVFRNKDTDSSHLRDFDRFLGTSMLVVDGADHRRMRGASSAPFTPAGLSRARVGEIIAETLERHV